MNTIDPTILIKQLNWRYATKQFDPHRKISPQDWSMLEQALVLTPSSFGLQPWKFIVVTDPATKKQLVSVSMGQRQVADCSHMVVFAIKTGLGERDIDSYLDRIAEVRRVPRASLVAYRDRLVASINQVRQSRELDNWSAKQVYIALGNFLTSAALVGIDACPMEGIEPAKYDDILGLAGQRWRTVVVAAAGYRAATDQYAALKKVRFPKEEVLMER